MRQRIHTILNHHYALGHVEPVKLPEKRDRCWKLIDATPSHWRVDQPPKRIRLDMRKILLPILENAGIPLSTLALAERALKAMDIEFTGNKLDWIKGRTGNCARRLERQGKIVAVQLPTRYGTVTGWAIGKLGAAEPQIKERKPAKRPIAKSATSAKRRGG